MSDEEASAPADMTQFGIGHMEANMGQDAYQANVAAAKANTAMVEAQTQAQLAIVENMKDSMRMKGGLVMIGLLACIPLYIILIIWLVKTLVI